jgi:hypothetical protein
MQLYQLGQLSRQQTTGVTRKNKQGSSPSFAQLVTSGEQASLPKPMK